MTTSFRKIVKPEHLNAANTLFGGTLVAWIDEACAMYAMCQMQTKRLVTLKISEMLFKKPARQGDILEFICTSGKVGNTSFTIDCKVMTKAILPGEVPTEIAHCEIIFVAVDENGRPEKFNPLTPRPVVRPEGHELTLLAEGPSPVLFVKALMKLQNISLKDATAIRDRLRAGERVDLYVGSDLYTVSKAIHELNAIGAIYSTYYFKLNGSMWSLTYFKPATLEEIEDFESIELPKSSAELYQGVTVKY